ncbi:hypothetical protein BKA57DRAFT_60964 [Linnemannia elongata]|nr:hypothetical protein BKA57DRAFT_60964 [Linnemannia elongata]
MVNTRRDSMDSDGDRATDYVSFLSLLLLFLLARFSVRHVKYKVYGNPCTPCMAPTCVHVCVCMSACLSVRMLVFHMPIKEKSSLAWPIHHKVSEKSCNMCLSGSE